MLGSSASLSDNLVSCVKSIKHVMMQVYYSASGDLVVLLVPLTQNNKVLVSVELGAC